MAICKLAQTQERGLYRWKWSHESYKSAACEYSQASAGVELLQQQQINRRGSEQSVKMAIIACICTRARLSAHLQQANIIASKSGRSLQSERCSDRRCCASRS